MHKNFCNYILFFLNNKRSDRLLLDSIKKFRRGLEFYRIVSRNASIDEVKTSKDLSLFIFSFKMMGREVSGSSGGADTYIRQQRIFRRVGFQLSNKQHTAIRNWQVDQLVTVN